MNRLIVTETGKYTSLDPLDADKTHNLPVARMVYLTPLQITKDNDLTSLVFEDFNYNESTKTIVWKMKKGLKYSDGTNITAEDVAFSVARMAHKRPKFPVIETIDGLEKWMAQNSPLETLPSGIRVDIDKISIKLTDKHSKPLFRFCLELFSIIPKKCVDLQTGKTICQKIPTSGLYKITDETEKTVDFERSHLEVTKFNGPDKIRFEYWPLSTVESNLSDLDEKSVMSGNESHFTNSALSKVQSDFKVHFLPASRFTDIDFNKSEAFFKDKLCRQIFASTFRNSFRLLSGESFTPESSIFTKIVPGYLSAEDLKKKSFSSIKDSDVQKCKDKLRLHPPTWAAIESEKDSNLNKAIQMTFKELGGTDKPNRILKSRAEFDSLFDSGNISISYGGSGFWAQDAAGDLQMLFTPGLHKSLDFVTKDPTLQMLIKQLKEDTTSKSRYSEINQYLHDEALFNVYSHVRRFFVSKKSSPNLDLPFAITSPFPWHLFEENK